MNKEQKLLDDAINKANNDYKLDQIMQQRLREIANQWEKLSEQHAEDTMKGYGGWMNWKQTATEDDFIKRGFTNWKRMFDEVMAKDKEPIEYIAFNNTLIPWAEAQHTPALHEWFDDDYGGVQGQPFTAWSATWVYFPIQYDGREWIGKAPRNPRDHSCQHQGGG